MRHQAKTNCGEIRLTYALGVAVAHWHFGSWDILHAVRLVGRTRSPRIAMARLWQLRDVKRNDCVHLGHLAASLHVSYLDQLPFTVDIKLEHTLLLLLLLILSLHTETHGCGVLLCTVCGLRLLGSFTTIFLL